MKVVQDIIIDKIELRLVQNRLRGRVLNCKDEQGYMRLIGFVGSLVDGKYRGEYRFEESASDVPGDLSMEDIPGLSESGEDRNEHRPYHSQKLGRSGTDTEQHSDGDRNNRKEH